MGGNQPGSMLVQSVRASTANMPQLGITGPGGPGTGALPPPTVGALTPPPVQSGGSNFASVFCVDNSNLGNVLDVPVYCLETGVTLTAISCGAATVAFSVPGGFGSSYHCVAQGGPGYNCANGGNYTYASLNGVVGVGATGEFHLTRT
jgi:hypothetical protein